MIIELPTHLTMGKRNPKNIPLNLNFYRNAHPILLNNMKIQFEEIVKPRLSTIPFMERVALTYRLFMPSKRSVDVANVCCIVDKFFCDTLKNSYKIPDDNMEVISSIRYDWGGVDKENPRVEVTLMENEPMEITTVVKLSDIDIRLAIEEYVNKELPTRDNHKLTVDMLYAEGMVTAHVTVGGAVVPETKPQARRGRPPKAAQTETAPTVEETVPEAPEATPEPEEEPVQDPIEEEPQEEGSIIPPPEQETEEEVQEEPVAEAAVQPMTPSKGLFPSKTTSSPTPVAKTPEKAPEAKPATPSKSLFNLKGLGANK